MKDKLIINRVEGLLGGIEDCSSLALCALDTVVRIEDDDDKLYACRNCVFRNVISMLVCPNEIKEDVLELR